MLCHSERSEESFRSCGAPQSSEHPIGFFAPLRRTGWAFLAILTFATIVPAATPTADGRLRIGGDGRGALSAGLSNYPLGAAYVYGTAEQGRSPDLFVAAGRFSHEPGLFLYRWVAASADGAPVFGARIEVRQPGEG